MSEEVDHKETSSKTPAPRPSKKEGTPFKKVTGHDPKNRHVHLEKQGEKFKVTKPATGFKFIGPEKEAKKVFEHQKSCSHN